MIFDEAQLKELEELSVKHEVVGLLMGEYKKYADDPSQYVRMQIGQMAKAIADDLQLVREGKESECMVLTNEDDKTYERILKFLTDGSKIMDNMKYSNGEEVETKKAGAKKGLPQF